jgi:hypothetical protein
VKHARRRTASGLAAVAALGTVAMFAVQGCDADPAAQAATESHSVTISQAQDVYQAYLQASDAAAQQGSATAGLANVADAQWEIVHGQYAALASSQVPVPRYQYGAPQYYVPALDGYPKWFVVSVPRHQVGSDTGDVPTLMVFGQVKAGTDWLLDGTAALEPGQQLPDINRGPDGYAVALDTRDTSLLLPPDIVGPSQAAVVDDGPTSEAASVVSDGPDTTGLYATQSAFGNSQTAKGLNYTWLMDGANFPVFSLKLTDGSALVLYGMYLNTTNEHTDAVKGSAIPIPSDFTPLLAVPSEVGYHAVYANWTYQYAAIDPPSTSTGKVTIIASDGGPTYGHAY